MNSALRDSAIRTLAVLVYSALIHAGIGALGLDEAWAQGAATIVATLVVYGAIRYGEQINKYVGLLLGSTRQPVYVKGEVVKTAVEAVKQVGQHQTPPASTVAAEDPLQPVVQVDPEADQHSASPGDT